MEEEKEIRNRIIAAARDQFYIYGFSKVTIDEIAAKLGMSKKTVYKHFASKDDLVREVTRATMGEMRSCCQNMMTEENVDFVGKVRNMMTFIAMNYAKMGKPLIEDLQKNAPHIWKEIDQFRREEIMNSFANLLKEGVGRGVFRKDIDKEIVLLFYMNTVQNIINPEILTQIPYSAAQVFETIVAVMFEGIMTESARVRYHDLQSIQQVQ